MKETSPRRCRTITKVIGAVLLILPNCVPSYWGNVSILTMSYVFFLHQPKASIVKANWVVSLYVVFRAFGFILYDFGSKALGKRCVVTMGILISDLAIFTCYFAVQYSLILLDVALGAGVGFGSGLLYGHSLHTVLKCADNNVGILTCIIQGSFSVGGIIINEFVTLYANPSNQSPELKVGRFLLFTQKNVIDKIPFLYLFMGGFSVVIHVIAFFILEQEAFRKDLHAIKEINNIHNKDADSIAGCPEQPLTSVHDEISVLHARDNNNIENHRKDFSPREMVKTTAFFVIWFTFLVTDWPMVLLANYYKAFGQIWIHDDHFLTDLGLIFMIANTLIRCGWGVVIDKLKVRTTLVVILSLCILLNTWFYFTPMIDKGVYTVAAILFNCLTGGLFTIFPAVMVAVFGKTNFSINYGILMSATILFNILGPIMIERILVNFGWFFTFFSSAAVNIIALFLLIIFIP